MKRVAVVTSLDFTEVLVNMELARAQKLDPVEHYRSHKHDPLICLYHGKFRPCTDDDESCTCDEPAFVPNYDTLTSKPEPDLQREFDELVSEFGDEVDEYALMAEQFETGRHGPQDPEPEPWWLNYHGQYRPSSAPQPTLTPSVDENAQFSVRANAVLRPSADPIPHPPTDSRARKVRKDWHRRDRRKAVTQLRIGD
jgi:hypothetical protein